MSATLLIRSLLVEIYICCKIDIPGKAEGTDVLAICDGTSLVVCNESLCSAALRQQEMPATLTIFSGNALEEK